MSGLFNNLNPVNATSERNPSNDPAVRKISWGASLKSPSSKRGGAGGLKVGGSGAGVGAGATGTAGGTGGPGGPGGPGGTGASCLGMIVRRRVALVEITRRRRGGVAREVEERRGVSEERGDVFGEPSRGSRWDMLRAGYGEEGGDDCSIEGAAAGCRLMRMCVLQEWLVGL